MKKKNTKTAEVRIDPKGRKLEKNELYDAKTGRYRYQYTDAKGKRQQVYSWTLTPKDSVPKGRKQGPGESLREKEAIVKAEVANKLNTVKGGMTVRDLAQIHIDDKWDEVAESTRNVYRTCMHLLDEDPFGKRKIRDVTEHDVKVWFKYLNEPPENADGKPKFRKKGNSTFHNIKGIMRPAFETAKKNRWVLDNPFDFPIGKKKYGGVKTRDALPKSEMRRFLDFLRTDKHFKRYFYGVYILFHTGLRISEFCGLTPDDVDFKNHVVRVERQLKRLHDGDNMLLYVCPPKSDNGIRSVPMSPDVEKAFREVMAARPEIKDYVVTSLPDAEEYMEATGFLWIDKNDNYEVAQHWENHIRWARDKFNKIFKEEMPQVTPHICRHTFCSIMANRGMNPKTLQKIMGHSSIEITLNAYTHLENKDVMKEFNRVMGLSSTDDFYSLDKEPELVSLADDSPDDEGEPDFDKESEDED